MNLSGASVARPVFTAMVTLMVVVLGAVATVVLSKILPHCAKGRFVVMIVDFNSCLWLMTWKNKFDPCWPSGR